jgi:hypothetical protein
METASQTLCLLLFPPAHQRFTTHADVRQAVAEFVNNLQTMAARYRAKEADRKTGVAATVRQRKQKAASTELLQPALDPGVAQEAQLREEKVTQRDAAAAEEGSFVRTVTDTRSGRKRTVRVSSSKFSM